VPRKEKRKLTYYERWIRQHPRVTFYLTKDEHEFIKQQAQLKNMTMKEYVLSLIKEGHESYRKGYEEGYRKGYDEGKKKGKEEGYEEGYKEGKAIGKEEGYDKGYEKGYREGYEKGFKEGYEKAREKTRLAEEARRALRREGFTVL
jgi:flagellar biosynthesis/type III secretory pathway protein FliH